MSTNQGFQQSQAIADATDAKFESMRDKPATSLSANQRDSPASSVATIPGYYHTTDNERDTLETYRMLAASSQGAGRKGDLPFYLENLRDNGRIPGGMPPPEALKGFKVDFTKADMEFFERRRREQEAYDFEEWASRAIDISDPGEARWMQEKIPEIWTRRERWIDDEINKEARACKILLRGIRDREDMQFCYLVDNGYVKLPNKSLWRGGFESGVDYTPGIFSIVGRKFGPTRFPRAKAPASFSPGTPATFGRSPGMRDLWKRGA